MAIGFMVSDRAINRERRDLCLRLKRLLHSRRRSRALMRAFRRAGPSTHESKHVIKPYNVDDINCFLEDNGLNIAVHVFSKSRLCARESGLRLCEHMRWAAASAQHLSRGVAAAASARTQRIGKINHATSWPTYVLIPQGCNFNF